MFRRFQIEWEAGKCGLFYWLCMNGKHLASKCCLKLEKRLKNYLLWKITDSGVNEGRYADVALQIRGESRILELIDEQFWIKTFFV